VFVAHQYESGADAARTLYHEIDANRNLKSRAGRFKWLFDENWHVIAMSCYANAIDKVREKLDLTNDPSTISRMKNYILRLENKMDRM